jgi:hypothetical protein
MGIHKGRAEACQGWECRQRTLKNVAVRFLQDFKSNADVHVFIHAGVIVYQRPLMLRFDKEVVVYSVMANIVNAARNDDTQQLQVTHVLRQIVKLQHAYRRLRNVCSVHGIVIRVWAISALHFLRHR